MPILLANVLLWTARRSLDGSTNQTQGATAYLSAVPAHLKPNTANANVILPDAAFKAVYYARIESGTDVAMGDYLTAITLPDGVTPWPGEMPPPTAPGGANTVWAVVYVRETAAGVLASREVWIDRQIIEGPAHP